MGEHQAAVPQKAIDIPTQQSPMSGVSQANVWREPHGGRVATAPAVGTQRGSPVTTKKNHRKTGQNEQCACRPRPPRIHQPADADHSLANTRAFPNHPSPLSREIRPAEHNQHKRGGGAGGGGTSSCRPAKSHRHSHPPKPNSCVSQANVWREPHGGRVASAPAGGTQRGSPITAKQNHRNTQQNDPFASRPRPARVHQPADADRSPANTRAFPKPASSRTQTTRPRRLFVNRPNRSIAAGTTWSTALPPSSHAATAERCPNRPAPAHKRLVPGSCS